MGNRSLNGYHYTSALIENMEYGKKGKMRKNNKGKEVMKKNKK
jgi:hypothetical protein